MVLMGKTMTVAKIQEFKNKQVKIILESGFAFVLYKGELCKYGVIEGEELSEANYNEIMMQVLPKRAKLRAMNLLKARPYTVKGLTDKLDEGGYPTEIIKVAIDYVSGFNYLNDYQYARDYIYTYKETKNKNKLFLDLTSKGVDKDTIMKAYDDEMGEDSSEYEICQIKKYITKKGYFDRDFTYDETQKLLASLYRKGFSPELIRKAVRTFD